MRRQLGLGQGPHVLERGVELGHDLVQPALAVGHDAEAALEARGQAGVEQLDEVGIGGRPREHVLDQLPEAVAADVLGEEVDHQASARPLGAVLGLARQVLGDVVQGGGQGVAAPLPLLVRITGLDHRLVEGGDGLDRLGVQGRQADLRAPAAHARRQRQHRSGQGHHGVAQLGRNVGTGDVVVRQLRRRGHGSRRGRRRRGGAERVLARRRTGLTGEACLRGLGAGVAVLQPLQRRRPEDRAIGIGVVRVAGAHRLDLLTHQSSSFRLAQSPATWSPSAGAVAKSRQSGTERSSSK